ncbi:MAG: thiamine pyrophosphate-binding protein [Sinimarinibacterium sp.]|jgi:acetolactate synthase-1/2/3 large subunit
MEEETTYGGKVVGEVLAEEGVDAVFGVYGSIGLAIEEANRHGTTMYHFRHEQSAGFAADAYARCLRKPGVCFTSSAPGFTNIISPIAQAHSAQSPVLLLNGQHGVAGDGMNFIQEGYAAEMLRPVTKWSQRVLDWNLAGYWTRKALTDSVQYPPAPVVLDFPRTTLNGRGPARQAKFIEREQTPKPAAPWGDPREVERAVKLLSEAKRPLIVAGDGVYWSDGAKALRELAEALNIPVSTRRTARGAVPESHPLAFSGGYRGALMREADAICLIGMRATYLEEWFEPPEWSAKAKYIQINESVGEIWPAVPTASAIVGSCANVMRQMLDCWKSQSARAPQRTEWIEKLNIARSKFLQQQREVVAQCDARPNMHPHSLGAALADVLDPSSTVIYDSFTATSFFTDKFQASYAGQILDAGLHQPVGHSIGMCVGAQVARPGRPVMALIGDGGFGIGGMDMETLVRYNLPAVIVLMNNSSWAGVAAGHDAFYPDMGSWENTPGVRYDRMMNEFGCHGEHVETVDQLRPALERAFKSGKPALVNVVADTDEIHPLRLRICWGDAWTRGDIEKLPPQAREMLKANASVRSIARVQKYWRDNGIQISAQDLAQVAGVDYDSLKK